MTQRTALRQALRLVRAVVGRAFAACIVRSTRLERLFVSAAPLCGRFNLPRGLYWATEEAFLRRLADTPERFRQLRIGRSEMWVDVTDHTGRDHYFRGSAYEPETTRTIQELLHAGDTFLDVGANIGFFSIVAALAVGARGEVGAFEPNPALTGAIADLATVNGVAAKIVVVAAAAAATSGDSVPLFLSVDSVLSTLDPARAPLRADFAFDQQISVPAVSVDDWLAARPSFAARLRLAKIDVEGVEVDVLKGMRRTLAQGIPAVICESEPDSEADTLLRNAGYVRSTLDVRRRSFGNYLYSRAAQIPC